MKSDTAWIVRRVGAIPCSIDELTPEQRAEVDRLDREAAAAQLTAPMGTTKEKQ